MAGAQDFRHIDYDFDAPALSESLLKPLSPLRLPAGDQQSTAPAWSDDTGICVSLSDLERSEYETGQNWQPASSGRRPYTQPLTTEDLSSDRGLPRDELTAQERQRVRTQSQFIKHWFMNHPAFPCVYATAGQIDELASAAGLTIQQVRTRLTNLRARIPSGGESSHSSPISTVNLSAYDGSGSEVDYPELLNYHYPFEAMPMDLVSFQSNFTPRETSLEGDIDHMLSATYDPFGGSLDEDLKYPSLTLATDAHVTLAKRKGKRRYPPRSMQDADGRLLSLDPTCPSSIQSALPRFHCTECGRSFKDAYNWERHESAVHLFHSTEWICQLDGNILDDFSCAFCREPFPCSKLHNPHNMLRCCHKKIEVRTFFRKDQFKQHLNQVHFTDMDAAAKKNCKVPDAWSREVEASRSDPRSLWCGFCQTTSPSTAQRMKHVAAHFRDGMDMVNWKVMPAA